MIAFIQGTVFKRREDSIIIEANGIGYQVYMSSRDIMEIENNQEYLIHTYMQVKEDGIALFGFLSEDDVDVFKLLITVSGVGPKIGLACLSVYSVSDIKFAIISEDDKTLSKVPGLGSKTAKKIILELKDKISLPDSIEENFNSKNKSLDNSDSAKNDAVLALSSLGYSQTEALQAIAKIQDSKDMDVEELIKQALKKLAFM
jgi:Holliday junction DNA helicase RuvA